MIFKKLSKYALIIKNISFKHKNVKICIKNWVFGHKHCEMYCVLTLHTMKLTRKNIRMHENLCSSYYHFCIRVCWVCLSYVVVCFDGSYEIVFVTSTPDVQWRAMRTFAGFMLYTQTVYCYCKLYHARDVNRKFLLGGYSF